KRFAGRCPSAGAKTIPCQPAAPARDFLARESLAGAAGWQNISSSASGQGGPHALDWLGRSSRSCLLSLSSGGVSSAAGTGGTHTGTAGAAAPLVVAGRLLSSTTRRECHFAAP